MKSAANGGVLKGGLQVVHVHVLLVASLGASQITSLKAELPSGKLPTTRVRRWKSASI